jgi:predicted RNase H-like HicB family nuclease
MKTNRQKLNVIVEKTNTGFSAFAEDLPVYTTGKNMAELNKNILEALNFYFEDTNKKIKEKEIHLKSKLSEP